MSKSQIINVDYDDRKDSDSGEIRFTDDDVDGMSESSNDDSNDDSNRIENDKGINTTYPEPVTRHRSQQSLSNVFGFLGDNGFYTKYEVNTIKTLQRTITGLALDVGTHVPDNKIV
eukprot:CAMPEP_0114659194 /NCGR_PEP_ID=MMETSP0191-20121206/17293_1 /TAXON_ID=126664 /ORGANISM="Sorites sp." /LENGTH=115 /DNA_ID=CAMNT_0001883551 /DNA_START=929 /DNA_END=1276 /DNA_ORIENTATION=-